jgi:hypothetical protein
MTPETTATAPVTKVPPVRVPALAVRHFVKRSLDYVPAPVGLRLAEAMRWISSPEHRTRMARQARLRETLGLGDVVRVGPFAGMHYPLRASGQGGLLPKLLGTYEQELHAVLDAELRLAPDVVIDIGAAEGYYAVGLALRLPGTRVIAFEMERPLHAAIRHLARANGVAGRIEIRGACTLASLAIVPAVPGGRRAPRVLVVCDVEGAEDTLLRPDRAPVLRTATIIVETHDALCPGVSDRLRERFARSHDLTVVPSVERSPDVLRAILPAVDVASPDAAFTLSEGRGGPMTWHVYRPVRWA